MEPGILAVKPDARILVTRTDRIGDLVLSTPVFEAIRKKYPGVHLACMTFKENREIIEGNPFLDEMILYDKRGKQKGLWGNFFFSRRLAAKKFDLVIHLHATNRMHILSWLAGIPIRIGWNRRAPWSLTYGFDDCKREGKHHEAFYNFELLGPLRVPAPDRIEPFFPVSERADRSLRELVKHRRIPCDRPWLIVSPSASCPSKRWPAEKFSEVARNLQKDSNAVVLVIGAPGDRTLCRRVMAALKSPYAFDLCGSLSLSMLGSLFRRSRLLVSNDSGPVHIASACGLPVISIFGRKEPGLSPDRWKPLGDRARFVWKDVGCQTCLAHRCQIGFLCLDAVSVKEVTDQAVELLDAVSESAGGVLR